MTTTHFEDALANQEDLVARLNSELHQAQAALDEMYRERKFRAEEAETAHELDNVEHHFDAGAQGV